MLGIKCPTAEPFGGAEIIDGTNRVASVTAGAWSPYLDCGIAYARFTKPGDWVGQSLKMKTSQGELVGCEIVTLPFYDTGKRIPRGFGE